MLKRLLAVLFASGLIISLGGCSSSNKDSEDGDAAAVESETGESLEGDTDIAEEGDAQADEFSADEGLLESSENAGLGSDELSAEEQLPEEGADTEVADAGSADDSGDIAADLGDDELSEDEAGAADDAVSSDSIAAAEPTPEPEAPIEEPGALADNSYDSAESMMDDTASSGILGSDESGEKKWVPVKKIAEVPFERNGVLANAVYIARPGDTLESVSMKIFGKNNTAHLKKVNPTLSTLKVGDKVYYNSPQRPTDSERLLTFYEDAGLAPEVYVSQAGDNIREVSQRLLGDSNSWKEVWSTNLDVESKGELSEGTRLRYWAGADIAVAAAPPSTEGSIPPPPAGDDLDQPAMQEAQPPVGGTMEGSEPPPPPVAMNEAPPPPMETMDAPPPPPPDTAAMGGMAEPPPPPPPPAPMAQRERKPVVEVEEEDPNQTMALAASAVLLIASVLLVVIIRKKKARRGIDFNTSTQTQIE